MNNKNHMQDIARKAFVNIPVEKENAKRIETLVKKNNKIIGYEIAGEFVSKEEAITLANKGMIKGVGIAKRNETLYLKSLPDGNSNNNLSNLPSKVKE